MPFKSKKQKRWMYANKPEMAKKWEKKVKEQKLNENPAVIATAARMAIQNADGKKVSVNTARQTKYADRDPAAHKKAKSIFQRIKDKFKKKDDKPKKKSAPKKQSKSDADYYARQYGGKVEAINALLEKNVPTDASKWSYYKGQAKKKFDVYPSAYANAWAAKKYKAAGGGWKKESVNEAPSKEGQDKLIKTFIDGALKKAGIKVLKFQPMKPGFLGSNRWGGFYTVKSSNKVDMPGQGKVKRGSAVLPFYVHKDLKIDLGVSSKDFILGKYSEMSKVVKNLKDFKKTDLNESLIKEATYVKGKMNNIFKLSGKQFIDGLVGNVMDSPSVEGNRIKAQASKKAKAQMLATYLKFKKDIEKIVKPFNDEITGR